MENSFEITTPLHPQVLRVARSFGDFRFKWTAETESDDNVSQSNIKGFRFLPPLEQAVTCFPEVISRKRSNRYFCSLTIYVFVSKFYILSFVPLFVQGLVYYFGV